MKVSEAKERVCPFIFQQYTAECGNIEGSNIRCICGDCMAWQSMKEKAPRSIGSKTGHFEDNKWLEKTDDKCTEYGYCQRIEK